jgi:hypothetical protein
LVAISLQDCAARAVLVRWSLASDVTSLVASDVTSLVASDVTSLVASDVTRPGTAIERSPGLTTGGTVPARMAPLPSPSEDVEGRIRDIVEGYIREHGTEDDPERAAGALRTAGREKSLAVIRKYRQTWENESAVDPDRLTELEDALQE